MGLFNFYTNKDYVKNSNKIVDELTKVRELMRKNKVGEDKEVGRLINTIIIEIQSDIDKKLDKKTSSNYSSIDARVFSLIGMLKDDIAQSAHSVLEEHVKLIKALITIDRRIGKHPISEDAVKDQDAIAMFKGLIYDTLDRKVVLKTNYDKFVKQATRLEDGDARLGRLAVEAGECKREISVLDKQLETYRDNYNAYCAKDSIKRYGNMFAVISKHELDTITLEKEAMAIQVAAEKNSDRNKEALNIVAATEKTIGLTSSGNDTAFDFFEEVSAKKMENVMGDVDNASVTKSNKSADEKLWAELNKND